MRKLMEEPNTVRAAYGERDIQHSTPPFSRSASCYVYWQNIVDDGGCCVASVPVGGRFVCYCDATELRQLEEELGQAINEARQLKTGLEEAQEKIRSLGEQMRMKHFDDVNALLEERNAKLEQEMKKMEQEMKKMEQEKKKMEIDFCQKEIDLKSDLQKCKERIANQQRVCNGFVNAYSQLTVNYETVCTKSKVQEESITALTKQNKTLKQEVANKQQVEQNARLNTQRNQAENGCLHSADDCSHSSVNQVGTGTSQTTNGHLSGDHSADVFQTSEEEEAIESLHFLATIRHNSRCKCKMANFRSRSFSC